MGKILTNDIEEAVVNLMGVRQNIIVPNVSWGLLNNHEADLLIVRPSGYAVEVEIKVSMSDLKKDFAKRHGHRDSRIKFLYYAIPEEMLERAGPIIPDDCGIISVAMGRNGLGYIARYRRRPKVRGTEKFSPEKMAKLLHLGIMRYWDMKRQANKRYRKMLEGQNG